MLTPREPTGSRFGAARRGERAASSRFLLGLVFAASTCAVAADPAQRHALEDRALVEPEAVLELLPPALAQAQRDGDLRGIALLQLAQANACRVIADWDCQHDAGARARSAAAAAQDVGLEVRGLILQARASMAQQDYSGGERLLGEAELRLAREPDAEHAADIDLAYSSLSFALGKHALATEYAERGLARLGPEQALPMQVRLLRNRARSLGLTGDPTGARASLDHALALAQRFADPKLTAELYLESARVAESRGDAAAQRRHGEAVIELGRTLRNSQLLGLGHEVLARAARGEGDLAAARVQMRRAYESFAALGLARDELRVARELIGMQVDADEPATSIAPLLRRYFAIERDVIQSDRAQAADDFDARLQYVEREAEVARLESEATLAAERERALAQANRLTRLVIALAFATLAVLAVFFVLQRRSNRRLRDALVALRESESRAHDLLRLSAGYVFLHDRSGHVLMANAALAEALGATPDSIIGRDLRELVVDSDRAAFDAYLARILASEEAEGRLRVRVAGGDVRIWSYSNRLAPAAAGRAYVVGHAVDVTEQIEQTEELRGLTERDALTGCYNRRFLDEFEDRHANGRWAVVNIDLDHFKQINDNRGHDEGDRVLIAMADFLQQRLRERDAVVRSGGDEFLLLLADADEDAVQALVERLTVDAPRAPCIFSLGWAARLPREPLADTLVRADRAMYERRAQARGANV